MTYIYTSINIINSSTFRFMKAKETSEKDLIKLKYATAIYLVLKIGGFPSVRQIAAESGMEQAHLQRVFSGKVDVSFTTSISVIEALKISASKFFQTYDSVTKNDIEEFKEYLELQKLKKGNRKIVDY